MIHVTQTQYGKFTVAVMTNDKGGEAESVLASRPYEPELMQAILTRVDLKGGIVLDIGAGIGLNTLEFADAVGPDGRVYAFEIQPVVFQNLCANVFLNGFSNRVIPANEAVVEREECVGFSYVDYTAERFSTGGARTVRNCSAEKCVNTTDIDAWELEDVRLIKIDVEGYEPFVLAGSASTISRCRPVLAMELSDHYLKDHGMSAKQMCAALCEDGYTVEQIGENDYLFFPR